MDTDEETKQAVLMLKRLSPSSSQPAWQPTISNPKEEDLLVLQMLTASGLVVPSQEPPKVRTPRFGGSVSSSEAKQIAARFIEDLQKTPKTNFRLSTLGHDFLKFVSMSRVPE
jgi:hypothetical protein